MTISNETQSETISRWQIDPGHTLVEFAGKHMFTTVKGQFKTVQGTILLDEADSSRSSVQVEIEANSLYSALDYRDNHLKSPDFLDVENFPTITFKSTSVDLESNDHANVIGNLTMHGVTREVVLDTQFTGRGKHPMTGGEVTGFEAKTSINRKDFGLTWNRALEAGGFLVGDIIKIEIATEWIKQAS